jgi:hypothetical protein
MTKPVIGPAEIHKIAKEYFDIDYYICKHEDRQVYPFSEDIPD